MAEAGTGPAALREYATKDLRLEVEAGIGRLTLDRHDSRVNLITGAVLEQLAEILDVLEVRAAEEPLRALVLSSGKRNSFIAGADLDELRSLPDAAAAAALSRSGQTVLRRLEMLPIPTFAAIDGVCLGSGVALALACSYRLASDSDHTQIGFPEIRLGLMPGIGGIVRLPRLIGLEASIGLVLSGRTIDAAAAADLGLVDAVVPAEDFEAHALSFAEQRITRGRTRTGARRNVARRVLEDTAPGRRVIFRRAAKQLLPQAPGSQQTARHALQAIADTIALPLDRAFEREAEAFGELADSEAARSLLHSYRALQRARRSPAGAGGQLDQVAVLGAGSGGSVATYLLAAAGVSVRLKDVRRDVVLQGVQRSVSLFSAAQRRERPTSRELDRLGHLITTTTGFGGFGTVDAAVIAVGGEIEHSITAAREAEDHSRDSCSILFLDPWFKLEAVEQALLRPERAAAVHLARPVDGYALAELAAGPGSSPDTITAARILLRRVGRTPVEVADDPATPLRRLLGIYFAEALRLVAEGARAAAVDQALTDAGFLHGPLERMEDYGVERGFILLEWLGRVVGQRMAADRMRPAGETRLPRQRLWEPRTPADRHEKAPIEPEPFPQPVIRRRIHLLLINEAAHILDQGLVPTPERLDVISILGLGFPRTEGGLLYHADRIGVGRTIRELEEHAAALGPRFEPAPYLQALASSERAFYSAPKLAGQRDESVL